VNIEYFSIQEAADYLGVSPQTLRRWDAAGKLSPVRHPANSYRFYRRADLEPFRMDYQKAEKPIDAVSLFQAVPANVEGNPRLREPQQEAHRAVREHFQTRTEPALLQIPVGCGKTGIIATLPFGISQGRVLVIAPNLTIRKSIAEALDVAHPSCFLSKTGVLSSMRDGPFAAVLDGPDANLHDCVQSHFVVTNIQQLASSADRWLPQFPPNFFDMIVVDEAHHNVAASWRKVFQRFPDAKVVGLTATPFRRDEQPLAGELIYRYSFAHAMMRGYIKQIHSRSAAPSEVFFTYHGDARRHTLDEVMKLREEQWFRKGVALSPECNQHIAESSIQRCNELRQRTGTKHQIIAAACSVDHARQVRRIYEQCGYSAREIHSGMSEDEKDAVLEDLRYGRLDCIVQVQMLGEGFDHPRLSVAAIFRPFRSLAPYIQFVGRVMRVIHQDAQDHPDNHGFIVSHVGLNNEEWWVEFRDLELEDQQLIQAWVQASTAPGESTENGQGRPRRFDVGMHVDNEIISHFIDQAFLDPEDDRVLDKILAQPISGMGLTIGDIMSREQLQAKLREKLAAHASVPTEIPVTPQRRNRSARHRLNDRCKSVAARVLTDLGFGRSGREIARLVPAARGMANHAALIKLLNQRVNTFMGVEAGSRQELSAEVSQRAFDALDDLGDALRDEIQKAGSRKDG